MGSFQQAVDSLLAFQPDQNRLCQLAPSKPFALSGQASGALGELLPIPGSRR
jgi:hypothetical protein